MRYRKKPVEIEAWLITRENHSSGKLKQLEGESDITFFLDNNDNSFYAEIDTLEGTMKASEGDWIIRGIKGEHYPCRGDIFRETYEKVDEEAGLSAFEKLEAPEKICSRCGSIIRENICFHCKEEYSQSSFLENLFLKNIKKHERMKVPYQQAYCILCNGALDETFTCKKCGEKYEVIRND